MTTKKKVASKAVPSKNVTEATVKPTAASEPARRTPGTTTKAPVKRTRRVATTTKTQVKSATPSSVTHTKATKEEKKQKSGKVKMARDSFTMPKDEYAELAILKSRLSVLGQPAKKSELLRAGIKLLSAMTDVRLKNAMAKVPVIKTGRPKKKK